MATAPAHVLSTHNIDTIKYNSFDNFHTFIAHFAFSDSWPSNTSMCIK